MHKVLLTFFLSAAAIPFPGKLGELDAYKTMDQICLENEWLENRVSECQLNK